MPGPLQVIAVGFSPGSDFQGRILDEVDRLQGKGTMRLLDLLLVAKDEDGTIEPIVIEGDEEELGALLSSIVPLMGVGARESEDGESSGLDPVDTWALAESLEPGSALAVLLIEHTWAESLFDTIAQTGGAMLGEGFLTADAGLIVGAEVAAMEEAAEVIAEAEVLEARAVLDAIAAQAEAAEAVAASEQIQAAAAASAIAALIEAGIVEEAAAHEAIEAVRSAGLIIAAADEMAADAVADDMLLVAAADAAAAEAIDDDAALVAAADEITEEAIAEDAAEIIAADELTDEAIADDAADIAAADELTEQAIAGDAAVIAAADEATAEAVAGDIADVINVDEATREAIEDDEAVVAEADEVAGEALAEAADALDAASITVAEARVLRYLPTRMTFALIAGKLGISRAAAKDRADRVYKKLGVRNRAEAVERARELGLIK